MTQNLANRRSAPHECPADWPDIERKIASALQTPQGYPAERPSSVTMQETHISKVFLTDHFAYKLKKAVKNDFVDYSTLEKRHHFCHEELRLDRRYAPELYLGVAPITWNGHSIEMEGRGRPIEYAVKMRRFTEDTLLRKRLAQAQVTDNDIFNLANSVAGFHQTAAVASPVTDWGTPQAIGKDAFDNFVPLESRATKLSDKAQQQLAALLSWSIHEYHRLESAFDLRKQAGAVRECHGDLHTGNIVWWKNQWTPFDGIEFNERFRWIDVLSDAGFLAMDLFACQHANLSNLFVSYYLESTGDYQGLPLLRWYMVYRALVRAKVEALRLDQQTATQLADDGPGQVEHYLGTASRFARVDPPQLWITHGLSGSGKSTEALRYVRNEGAIRIRSDVERKRLFQAAPYDPSESASRPQLYSPVMTTRTYKRLQDLAESILTAGYSVVVDATFLKQLERRTFAQLAQKLGATFRILDFLVPESELKQRIEFRHRQGKDASDADLEVLATQIRTREPLTAAEQSAAIRIKPSSD